MSQRKIIIIPRLPTDIMKNDFLLFEKIEIISCRYFNICLLMQDLQNDNIKLIYNLKLMTNAIHKDFCKQKKELLVRIR